MKVYDISYIMVIRKIKRLAYRLLPHYPNRRGRKDFTLQTKLATVALMTLLRLPLLKMEKLLENPTIRKLLGMKKPAKKSALSEWRKELAPLVQKLLKETFIRIMKAKGMSRVLAIVDTTGFKLDRASTHYEERIGRKKKFYAKAIVVYSPDVDAVYFVGVAPDSIHDTRMMKGEVLDRIVNSGFSKAVVADRGFDDSSISGRLLKAGVWPFIQARGGKLRPRFGLRLVADSNYAYLRSFHHFRSLVESLISSIKCFVGGFVRSRTWRGRATEILIGALVYNVSVMVKCKLL